MVYLRVVDEFLGCATRPGSPLGWASNLGSEVVQANHHKDAPSKLVLLG